MSLGATLDRASAGTTLWDAVVIGAGPAGAMSARELARRGILTLLIERTAFPRFKVCGACLNHRAVACLNDAGLDDLLPQLGAVPTRCFRVFCGKRSATLDLPGGVAVSRAALDMALVEAAVNAGAQFLPETTARLAGHAPGDSVRSIDVCGHDGPAGTIHSRIVLAADGLGNPALRENREFAIQVSARSRLGVGVMLAADSDRYDAGTIHMAVGRGGYVGLVRVEGGHLNLAAAMAPRLLKDAGSPAAAVAAILSDAGVPELDLEHADGWRGTLPLTRQTLRPVGDRVFVLGDSAGYLEPFTGEGMAWALDSGVAVAPLAERALRGWNTTIEQEWLQIYRRLVRGRQRWCRAFAWLLRSPGLARWAVRLAAARPALFGPVVSRLNRPILQREGCPP